jgi:outer membrane protein
MRNLSFNPIVWAPGLGLALLSCSASAVEVEEGFHGFLGAGVAYRSVYDGAEERRARGTVIPMLSYRKGAFEASTLGGLRYWALDGKDLKLAFVVGADAGRADKKSNSRPGSDLLKGMGTLKSTVEVGVAGSWSGAGIPLGFDLMTAPGKKGHGGTHGSFNAAWPFFSQGKLQLEANASLAFGDKRYNQSYYGVTTAQAANSQFKAFNAGAGFHGLDVGVSARYPLTGQWGVMGTVGYHRLLGDAAKSPLTQRKGSPTLLLGVGYQF